MTDRPSSRLLRRAGRRYVLGRRRLQPGFRWLHRLAVAGMNYGPSDPDLSGETRVLDLLAQHTRGRAPVIFDVGANVGAYAHAVLERFGSDVLLFCFEPSPTAFAQLREQHAARPNIRHFNAAVADREGTASLFTDRPGSAGASLYERDLRHYGIGLDTTEEVSVRRLDHVFAEEGLDRIDLLKLDAEGSEFRALLGAGELLDDGSITAIQFEFGGTSIDARVFFRDFYGLLGDRYAIYRVLQDGLWPVQRYSEEHEIFATINFLCLLRGQDGQPTWPVT